METEENAGDAREARERMLTRFPERVLLAHLMCLRKACCGLSGGKGTSKKGQIARAFLRERRSLCGGLSDNDEASVTNSGGGLWNTSTLPHPRLLKALGWAGLGSLSSLHLTDGN